MPLPFVLARVSTAVMKHHDQRQRVGKSLQGKLGRQLKLEAGADARHGRVLPNGLLLTACSSRLAPHGLLRLFI